MKKDKCSICNDEKGKVSGEFCLDNPKHPTYEERYDIWDDLTYLDCWGFIRINKTKEEQRVFNKNKKDEL